MALNLDISYGDQYHQYPITNITNHQEIELNTTDKVVLDNIFLDLTGVEYYNGTSKTASIPIPQGNIYTYDGTIKSIDYETAYINVVSGTISAINAGNYSVTFALNDPTLVWEDQTTEHKTINWSIEAIVVAIPYANPLLWNQQQQSPTWIDYDATRVIKTGSEIEIDKGKYPVIFSLIQSPDDTLNYKWTDNTYDDKIIYWSIQYFIVSQYTSVPSGQIYEGGWIMSNLSKPPASDTYTPDHYEGIFIPIGQGEYYERNIAMRHFCVKLSIIHLSNIDIYIRSQGGASDYVVVSQLTTTQPTTTPNYITGRGHTRGKHSSDETINGYIHVTYANATPSDTTIKYIVLDYHYDINGSAGEPMYGYMLIRDDNYATN